MLLQPLGHLSARVAAESILPHAKGRAHQRPPRRQTLPSLRLRLLRDQHPGLVERGRGEDAAGDRTVPGPQHIQPGFTTTAFSSPVLSGVELASLEGHSLTFWGATRLDAINAGRLPEVVPVILEGATK